MQLSSDGYPLQTALVVKGIWIFRSDLQTGSMDIQSSHWFQMMMRKFLQRH